MPRILRVASLGVLSCLVPACAERPGILGPTPADQGVVIYIHAGFAGSSQAVAADVRNLAAVEGPCSSGDSESPSLTWEDCISSIQVRPGWAVTLYRDRDFKGASLDVVADATNLSAISGPCKKGGYNDCVSSLKVYKKE